MYNLIEFGSSYSETTGSLWFYSKNKAPDFIVNIVNTDDSKSFKYKTKLLGNTVAYHNPNHTHRIMRNEKIVAALLKYLSNFWRSIEIPLINYKVELKLRWTKYSVLSKAGNDNLNNSDNNRIIFTIKGTKLYVVIVTLSARDN